MTHTPDVNYALTLAAVVVNKARKAPDGTSKRAAVSTGLHALFVIPDLDPGSTCVRR
jgi:hypothetical protein